MPDIDAVIHQPVRLRIMASLMALGADDQAEFSYLKRLLEVTDGNLGAHLGKLEEAGYIAVEKKFMARKPCTLLNLTHKGRSAFADHVQALEEILATTREVDSSEATD
ncbi:MAG: transcriptional regulator [bacterium]|nr:transcriptional regulator [bacterium]